MAVPKQESLSEFNLHEFNLVSNHTFSHYHMELLSFHCLLYHVFSNLIFFARVMLSMARLEPDFKNLSRSSLLKVTRILYSSLDILNGIAYRFKTHVENEQSSLIYTQYLHCIAIDLQLSTSLCPHFKKITFSSSEIQDENVLVKSPGGYFS